MLSAVRLRSGEHVDLRVLVPEGTFIRIDAVRSLWKALQVPPSEAAWRVIIFDEAERLHPEAANALLKNLEEPPSNTLFVLCASNPAQLPSTVLSRCQQVRFARLEDAIIERQLKRGLQKEEDVQPKDASQKRITPEELRFLVGYAQGRLLPDLLESPNTLLELQQEVVHAAQTLISTREGYPPWLLSWSDKTRFDAALGMWELWFRDVMLACTLPQAQSSQVQGSQVQGSQVQNIQARDIQARGIFAPATLQAWCALFSSPQGMVRALERCQRVLIQVRSTRVLHLNRHLIWDTLWYRWQEALGSLSHPAERRRAGQR